MRLMGIQRRNGVYEIAIVVVGIIDANQLGLQAKRLFVHQTSMQLETVVSPEGQTAGLTFMDRLSGCAVGGGPPLLVRRLLVPQSMAVEKKFAITFDAGVRLGVMKSFDVRGEFCQSAIPLGAK